MGLNKKEIIPKNQEEQKHYAVKRKKLALNRVDLLRDPTPRASLLERARDFLGLSSESYI